jgi:hypothetical protein
VISGMSGKTQEINTENLKFISHLEENDIQEEIEISKIFREVNT